MIAVKGKPQIEVSADSERLTICVKRIESDEVVTEYLTFPRECVGDVIDCLKKL